MSSRKLLSVELYGKFLLNHESFLVTIPGNRNVFQKIAIGEIVCQILIKSSCLGSIAGKRKIAIGGNV
jgi:hypothetical protein